MAFTIDAGPQSPTMNCYLTIAEADEYFSSRWDYYDSENNGGAGVSTWQSFDSEKKTALLVTATRTLEGWRYVGLKAVRTQPLLWPRQLVYDWEAKPYLTTEVPEKVKWATCEMAYWIWNQTERILDDWTADQLSTFKVGPLDLTRDPRYKKMNLRVLDLFFAMGPDVLMQAGTSGSTAKRIVL
jgi:hypothetical protein